jgi:glycosyltransferase involved in cell wall biosynthesis
VTGVDRPLRIATSGDQTLGVFPVPDPSGGGLYQYSLSIAEALGTAQERGELGPILTVLRPHASVIPKGFDRWPCLALQLEHARVKLPFITSPTARRTLRRMRHALRGKAALAIDPEVVRSQGEVGVQLLAAGIDLALHPAPSELAFEAGVPYVMAIHDLQHRLQPSFPEVSANGALAYREYLFRNGARFASAVLTDSDIGREDVLEAYAEHGVQPERVHVLPFVTPPAVRGTSLDDVERVHRAYGLPTKYLFYPAQFWPHKNHARLAEAVGILRDGGVRVNVVLCGSRTGALRAKTFAEFRAILRLRRIESRFTILGYVPDEDMAALYVGATGLVFPTFFGPTNIPIVEAWMLGCPVITSDLRGVREQVGDAALLADPRSAEELAEAIRRLLGDDGLRAELARRGRERVAAYTPDDFRDRLVAAIRSARELGPPATFRTQIGGSAVG